MPDPLLDHPRAFVAKACAVLGGREVRAPGITGFVSSQSDAFLNQFVARVPVSPAEVDALLDGRPAFVWLAEETGSTVVMQGMTAELGAGEGEPAHSIAEVAAADLDAWHEVYAEVLGDPLSREDWRRVHEALGPDGDGSLVLLLARVDGAPASVGGVFFTEGTAGLYCFATLESMQRRGLATAVVLAAHDVARKRGIRRALLQATPAGRPVYARSGYRDERRLPVLRV